MSEDSAAFDRRFDVSRETLDRLQIFAGLLKKWSPKINLVSKSTLPHLWDRHIVDSAQVLSLAPEAGSWADLGSGGGFPGAVVAILASEQSPGQKVTLVESDQRKATFLRTVSRETGVTFDVITKRIEEAPPLYADIVSARALAPLSDLLGYAERHMAQNGTAIFLKGATAKKELAAALDSWRFTYESIPSQTDEDAVVLKIGDIERV